MENYYEYDVGAGKYLQWYVVRLEKWYGDERNNREHPNFVIVVWARRSQTYLFKRARCSHY
jgi:hypothetical protein